MAEKLDDIDRQIERELHNLSLDELSTSDADSVADQSLSNSPTKDSVSFQQMYLMIFYVGLQTYSHMQGFDKNW